MRISDWSSDVCSSDLHRPEFGVDALEIVGKIIVVEFGRIERRQQDRGDAEPLQIIEAVGDALKVAVTVTVAVAHRSREALVEDFLTGIGGGPRDGRAHTTRGVSRPAAEHSRPPRAPRAHRAPHSATHPKNSN